jgi:hypothetical protein
VDLVSLRAYAERRGVSLAAVRSAVTSGRIARAMRRNEAGKILGIDPEQADALWKQHTDPAQAERKTAPKSPADDYYNHRSERERINAELALLELEQKQGKLVEAAAVELEVAAMLRQVRDGVLRAFEVGEAMLAANTPTAQVRSAFRRMGGEILEQLAAKLGNMAQTAQKSARARARAGRQVAHTRARANGKHVGRSKPDPEQ